MLVAAYRSTLTIIIASVLSFSALAFVTWRFVVVMKAQATKSDREYDHEGKYDLAPEYHYTESATEAAERKRRSRT